MKKKLQVAEAIKTLDISEDIKTKAIDFIVNRWHKNYSYDDNNINIKGVKFLCHWLDEAFAWYDESTGISHKDWSEIHAEFHRLDLQFKPKEPKTEKPAEIVEVKEEIDELMNNSQETPTPKLPVFYALPESTKCIPCALCSYKNVDVEWCNAHCAVFNASWKISELDKEIEQAIKTITYKHIVNSMEKQQ